MRQRSSVKTRAANYSSELIERRWLSNKTFEITLTKPKFFEYMPGQWIRLLHHAVERDYSLVSSPTDPGLALCIRNVAAGTLSPGLSNAPVGSRFNFNGPRGYFTFRPSDRPAIFVATGTGLAPFVSMARSNVTGFTFLHGVQTTSDIYYASEFKSVAKLYVTCISGTDRSSGDYFQGRVTDYLRTNLDPGSYDFYLCGRREMIREVTFLIDDKFPGSLIFTETFY
jgi:benzoate/toluate 1,2-dioxygenase reductase component